MKLKYQSDDISAGGIAWFTLAKVTAVNTSIAGCDPNADSCASVGAWPSATYDAYTPSAVTGPDGRITSYSYDGSGRLTGMRRPGASSDDVAIGYDGNGQVHTIGKVGLTWTYLYDPNSAPQRQTVTTYNPDGTHRTFVADTSIAEPLSVTDEAGAPTGYLYSVDGHLSIVTHPEGNETLYEYDLRDNVTKMSWTSKTSINESFSITSKYEDTCSNQKTCNQPIWTRDANGNQTDYEYDPTHGGVTLVTAPAGTNGVHPQTRYSYVGYADQAGGTIYLPNSNFACRTAQPGSCDNSADQIVVDADYGSLSNNLLPLSITRRAGDRSVSATMSMSYDAIGNMVTTTDPVGAQTRISYNADRQVTETISADPDGAGPLKPRAMRMNYNVDGTVASKELGTDDGSFQSLQQVTTSYDGFARPIRQVFSAGGTTYSVIDTDYDVASRLTCTAVRMNPAAFGTRPYACDLGAQGTDGPDRITLTRFDSVGRVGEVDTGLRTNVEAIASRTFYTLNGQVASKVDANNNQTNYTYDKFDRLSRTYYPVPSTGAMNTNGNDHEDLGYDARGLVTSRRLRDGQTVGYDYDALGRRTSDYNPHTSVSEVNATYAYDNLGHLTRAGDENGWFSAWDYDALGRVSRQYSNVFGNGFQYDAAGRMTRQTWDDGFAINYGYDAVGEMKYIQEGSGYVPISFDYDDLGRRTVLNRANGPGTSYGYDGASRLTGLTHGGNPNVLFGYGYNAAGQITSRTSSNDAYAWANAVTTARSYGVNGLNQYTQSGSVTPSYDARGNLTQAGGESYVYDTRNQLYTTGSGGLFYRPPSGLLSQLLWQGSEKAFDYVGDRLATETSGGVVQRRYVYGPGSDEPLIWYEGSGTSDRRYLHADERGSIVAVTDNAGNTSAINTYDEFGIPGPSNQGRFQYTGQKWLPELGMYDYKARMYSPTLGRFLQTDPIGYGDGLNWYNYAGGDPVNGRDPTGTDVVVYGGQPAQDAGLGYFLLRSNSTSTSFNKPSTDGEDVLNTVVVTGHRAKRGAEVSVGLHSPYVSLSALALIGVGDGSPQSGMQDVSFGPCKPSPLVTCTNPIDPRVYRNIIQKHLLDPAAGKSVFGKWALNPVAFMVAVGNVLENPYKTIAPGVREYTGNAGWIVGTDRYTGQPTAIMTVTVQMNNSLDGYWSVSNAYPGRR